jgi:nucleoside-diphosphate-sugar epimerase
LKTLLITGAHGFIGQTLCKKMLAGGWRTFGTVRSAKDIAGSLPAGADAVHIETIGPDTDWSKTLWGVDTVVHTAARVHRMQKSDEETLSEYRRVNVAGTERLARMAASAGVRRFIFLSSIKVNGEGTPLGQPFTETDAPSPQDAYALSKWEAEQSLTKVSRETGLEVVVLRSPLVYGPEVKANFLRLMQWVAWGVPLPFGATRNRRSLIYIGNLVSAIDACLTHPSAANQTFLVSDGEDVSTSDLIRGLAGEMGRKACLVSLPPALLSAVAKLIRKGQEAERLLSSLQVDSSRIRQTLNWQPPYTLQAGIRQTVDWYNGDRKAQR